MINKKKSKKFDFVGKIKKNPWKLTTFVFAVLAIILMTSLIVSNSGLSSKQAGENFVDYINSLGAAQIEYVDSVDFSLDLYQVTVLAEEKEIPVYVTKDGLYYVQGVMPLVKQEAPVQEKSDVQEIVKSDKPLVELFVMSYCPYGTQAEKGIIPAIEALGSAVDFELRFVYYSMHPTQGEVEENLNDYCIQRDQKDKLLPYLKCFLDSQDGASCLDSVGIDKDKLSSCVSETDSEYNVLDNLNDKSSWMNGRFPHFDIDADLNTKYAVAGSPTLVINGNQASSARDSASYLDAICKAFNNAPEACNTELSSSPYSPGFGYTTTSAGSDAQCG